MRSISKVSELDMEYTFDCYFRQTWIDSRLSYRDGPKWIIVNVKMMDLLWKPYTYFENSRESHVIFGIKMT